MNNRLNFIRQINQLSNVNPEEFAGVLVRIFDPIMMIYNLLEGHEYEAIENAPIHNNAVTCFAIRYPTEEAATSCYNILKGIGSFAAYERIFNIQSSLDKSRVIISIF